MKKIAWVLIAIGVVWGSVALNMNTTVYTPGGDVHNLGLMHERQVHIMGAIAAALAGVLLLGFSTLAPRQAPEVEAEPTKAEPEPSRNRQSGELRSAIAAGDADTVRELLASGYRWEQDGGSVDPIEYAELFGHTEIAQLLKDSAQRT